MPKNILVASVHSAFGELLRLSLDKSGRYAVRLASSCREARDELGNNPYAMAILDADLSDGSVQTALPDIVRRFPTVPLILFPPQNNPHDPLMKGLPIKAWIRKPFYLPDLLEAADAVSAGGTWAPRGLDTPTVPSNLAWLREDLEQGSPLSNLLQQDCLAAVFLTVGGPIIAQAGNLPASVGKEIIALVNKSWRDDESTDLVRYTHLEAAKADVMVYVTMLEKPLLAALIFPSSMPLMRARAIAVQAGRSLHPKEKTADREPPPVDADGASPAEQAAVWQAEVPNEGESVDGLLLELLASAPSPDPARAKPKPRPNVDWLLDENIVPMEEQEVAFPWEVEPTKPIDPWGSNVAASDTPTQPPDFQPTAPGTGMGAQAGRLPAEANQIFTCILIPRQVEMRLEGSLTQVIEQALPLLCLHNGWNLRNLQITPQALQFTVEVAPSISAGYLIRVLRQHTTQQIIERYPDFIPALVDGDFWAPGFLMISGGKSPAPQVLQDFIRQTRRRQGLTTG